MKKFKIIIDILLFIVTISLFDIGLTGNLNHEILGVTLGILVTIHIVLNFKWIKYVSQNLKNVNIKTKIMYITNIFIMLIYLGSIICGALISAEIFNFKMSSNLFIVISHLILGRLAIIAMFIHLGLHLDRILTKIKSKKLKRVVCFIYTIIVLLITVYFLYTLTHSFQWTYAFGNIGW